MLKNIEIKEIPPTIVYEYPKVYTYDELPKNIEYLYKIADKTSNGVIICLGDNLNFVITDTVKLCYPISKKLFTKFKRNDLFTLNRSECIYADFNPACYQDITIALENLCEMIKDKGYKAILPYRIVYVNEISDLFYEQQKFTMQIQIPIEKL